MSKAMSYSIEVQNCNGTDYDFVTGCEMFTEKGARDEFERILETKRICGGSVEGCDRIALYEVSSDYSKFCIAMSTI